MGFTRTCMTSDDTQGKKCPVCGKEMEGTGMLGIVDEFSINGIWWSCPHCGHTEAPKDGGMKKDSIDDRIMSGWTEGQKADSELYSKGFGEGAMW